MAISRKDAEAAMNALRMLNGPALFLAMKESGGYLFQKHMTKATALKAAREDQETKGYFKKLVTKQVTSVAEYKGLTKRQLKYITGLSVTGKQLNRKQFGKNEISSTWTEALSQLDYINLLFQAVRTPSDCMPEEEEEEEWNPYYQAAVNADQRFLYVNGMQPGYVGRSIDEHENKSKYFKYLVLIVVAPGGGSPFLLNMFPAQASYLNNKTKLV